MSELRRLREQLALELKRRPHPQEWGRHRGLNYLDHVDWVLENAGPQMRNKTIEELEVILKEKKPLEGRIQTIRENRSKWVAFSMSPDEYLQEALELLGEAVADFRSLRESGPNEEIYTKWLGPRRTS